MNKMVLGLLLASSFATPVLAADGDQAPPPAGAADAPKAPSFTVFLEGSYVFNHNGHGLPYAEYYGPADESTDSTDRYPFKVGHGEGWEFSAGLGAKVTDKVSLNAAYTGLRTNNRASTGMFPDYAIISVLPAGNGGSASGVGTSYNEARVHTDVAGDIVDFNAGYDVGLGEKASLTVLGGVRYAQFHQTTDTNLYDSDGFEETTSHRRSRYTGVGPALGFKAEYPLGDQGFSIDGSALGSVLFGRQRSLTTGHFLNGDGSASDPLITRQIRDRHTAKTVNTELGLTYHGQLPAARGVALTFGYKLSYYDGVVDTRNGSSGDGTARYGKVSDDILVHGPFMRFTFQM